MLSGLPRHHDPNLLVGFETSDDAGVYRLNEDTALIHTVDVITPPVDDPYVFGQIGAANALSDLYAMGGRPLTCLNLVGFPSRILAFEILQGIIEGALRKITEADAVLAGGHTIDDEEPKFGLSVTGVVHPQKYWSNAGAKPGDVLILTKPVGSGVLFNANLKGWVSDAAFEECLRFVTTLNRSAAEIMGGFDIHAATDITGFGLAGHALEMAKGSGVALHIHPSAVPVMREATDMYARGMSTGIDAANRALIEGAARFDASLPASFEQIMVDPQTNGGLLASVPPAQSEWLLRALHDGGVEHARIIGDVHARDDSGYLVFK